jgi:hypothetical protein
MSIKSFLGKQIDNDKAITSDTLVIKTMHDAEYLNQLTKKEVIAYGHQHSIVFNSRKKKEEIIEIILRS